MTKPYLQYKINIEKHLKTNQWHEALQECLEAQKLYSDNSEINFFLAQVYFDIKDLDNAEIEVIKAIQNGQNLSEALNLYGAILMSSGKIPEAIEVFIKSVNNKPRNWKPYYNLGNIYFAQSKYKEALSKYFIAFKYKKSFLVLERIYALLQTKYFMIIYIISLLFVFLPFNNSKIIAIPFAVICFLYFIFLTKVSLANKSIKYAVFNFILGLMILILHIFSIYK